MNLRAITVCVDYHDLLNLTLPYNRLHFSEVWVVTSAGDEKTRSVADSHGANVVSTDLFYADGAKFNKWRALENGLDIMGRTGWLCLLDADILWPKYVPPLGTYLQKGCLFTPYRRMAPLMDVVPPEEKWLRFPRHRNVGEFAGYSQIFHASDKRLGKPPWHDTRWMHAGGADSFFQRKWPATHKVRPPFEVLHLGPAGVNWAGRTSAYVDGSIPKEGEERRAWLRNVIRKRRESNGNPYRNEKLP